MASILTDAEKKLIQLELDNVRDTFFRDIYVYIRKATESPNEITPDFNPLYGSKKETTRHTTSRNTLEKITIQAVVKYENFQDEKVLDAQSQMNLTASDPKTPKPHEGILPQKNALGVRLIIKIISKKTINYSYYP